MHIYVITDPERKLADKYKIGYHTGSKKKLDKRYITSMPNMEVMLFLEVSDAKILESKLLKVFQEYRVKNKNGKYSEWIKLEYEIIEGTILREISLSISGIDSIGTNIERPAVQVGDISSIMSTEEVLKLDVLPKITLGTKLTRDHIPDLFDYLDTIHFNSLLIQGRVIRVRKITYDYEGNVYHRNEVILSNNEHIIEFVYPQETYSEEHYKEKPHIPPCIWIYAKDIRRICDGFTPFYKKDFERTKKCSFIFMKMMGIGSENPNIKIYKELFGQCVMLPFSFRGMKFTSGGNYGIDCFSRDVRLLEEKSMDEKEKDGSSNYFLEEEDIKISPPLLFFFEDINFIVGREDEKYIISDVCFEHEVSLAKKCLYGRRCMHIAIEAREGKILSFGFSPGPTEYYHDWSITPILPESREFLELNDKEILDAFYEGGWNTSWSIKREYIETVGYRVFQKMTGGAFRNSLLDCEYYRKENNWNHIGDNLLRHERYTKI